jgi:hypothetical protein
MVGLNADPSADQSYSSLDYAWYCFGDGGTLQIYESNSLVGTFGTYTAATVLAITYDGTTVTYWKDGVSIRTVTDAGKTFFLDSSFNTVGGGVNSLCSRTLASSASMLRRRSMRSSTPELST